MLDILAIKNKPHAIILVNNSLANINEYIAEYIKSIIGDETIDLKKYRDLIWLDNTIEGIKKHDIKNIIDTFSYSAKEVHNKKFYVIKNIENINAQSLNSLLKFLEEPHGDIYAIFTCKNINNVLPTIKSRCQYYQMPTNYSIEKKYDALQLTLYDDYDTLVNDIDSGLYDKLFKFANNLINTTNIAEIKSLSDQFKKMEYYEITIILKIIFYYTKKECLLEFIDKIYLNPNKILLFNQVFNCTRKL